MATQAGRLRKPTEAMRNPLENRIHSRDEIEFIPTEAWVAPFAPPSARHVCLAVLLEGRLPTRATSIFNMSRARQAAVLERTALIQFLGLGR
jgi:hypothetical protein